MRWSIKLLRVGGIDVRIHLTFLLFLAWIALAHYRVGGRDAAVVGVTFILAIFGCVLLHEFGHAIAARAFGIRTPDITLLPIGGVARLQRMPDRPWQELVVALAGPAVNVVIAGVLILFLGRGTDLSHLENMEQPQGEMLSKLASVNIILVLFNLIPAFPMDGGRVLRALLATSMSYARATQIAAWVGQALAFALGFAGLFYNPMLIFIAFFIFLGAQQESSVAQLKEVSENLTVSDAMMTQIVRLPDRASLDEAVEALLRTAQHEFPVVDGEDRIVGVLTRDHMISGLRNKGAAAAVTEVMHRDLPVLHASDPFSEALRLMQETRCPALPVVDYDGRFVGLITAENVGELMMVRSARPQEGGHRWRMA